MTDAISHLFRDTDRPLYVISDLHIGDGSSRDNLIKGGKADLLCRFLDEVEKRNGILVILGDFFELWRYSMEAILTAWHTLIDRIASMDLIYVPGNHDSLFDKPFRKHQSLHRIFESLHAPFVCTLGERTFKFMHGHEVDPIISDKLTHLIPAIRLLSGAFEFSPDRCLVTCDRFSDALLELGEQFLHGWHKLTRQLDMAIYEHLGLSNDQIAWLKRPLRTHKMLARFFQQQDGLYDITITGHTHKAGRFGQWYFNCGCWTQSVVNYLVIQPDGHVQVKNWNGKTSSYNRNLLYA